MFDSLSLFRGLTTGRPARVGGDTSYRRQNQYTAAPASRSWAARIAGMPNRKERWSVLW